MKGYLFNISDLTVIMVIEGDRKFILDDSYDFLKNNDNTGLSFDDELLTITTDTIFITQD